MGIPFGVIDEFEIKGTGHPTEADRIWTRSTLGVAECVADSAARLGYTHVEVVNTFGGVRSDPLYVVEGRGPGKSLIRD